MKTPWIARKENNYTRLYFFKDTNGVKKSVKHITV